MREDLGGDPPEDEEVVGAQRVGDLLQRVEPPASVGLRGGLGEARALLAEHLEEDLHDPRIELGAGALAQLGERLVGGQRGTVGTV